VCRLIAMDIGGAIVIVPGGNTNGTGLSWPSRTSAVVRSPLMLTWLDVPPAPTASKRTAKIVV
jgi:hypothetical protein